MLQNQSSDVYVGKNIKFSSSYEEDKVNPKSIVDISNINNFSSKRILPTQKPIKLFEWLIKSYSIEKELSYFQIIKERLEKHGKIPTQATPTELSFNMR